MNIFDELVLKENANDVRIGRPFDNQAHLLRTMNAMSLMTGGNGFRVPPKQPKADAQGMTRGDRKRKMRAETMLLVSETRPEKFLHSSRTMPV